MKFVDEASLYVKAGDGGRGCVSFRREKYIPRGGPDGGDGGKGGDVIIVGKQSLISLLDFKYKRHYKAENGRFGAGRNKTGRNGEDLVIHVPLGTIVQDETTGKTLADGRVGETIKVRNVDSNRIILCKVRPDGTVEPVI